MPDRSPDSDAALERMVDAYAVDLYRFARARVSDADAAEDLVQETFVAAVRAFSSFRGRSSERTWLTGILKHKIVDYYRKESREARHTRDVPEPGRLEQMLQKSRHWNAEIGPLDWSADPAALTESRELFETLRRCLAELPERARAIFRMRELENSTPAELCDVFQCSPGSLRMTLHRARFQIRHCLERNWFAGEAGRNA